MAREVSVKLGNCQVGMETSLIDHPQDRKEHGTFAGEPGENSVKVHCSAILTTDGSSLTREIRLQSKVVKDTLCAACMGPTEKGKECKYRVIT